MSTSRLSVLDNLISLVHSVNEDKTISSRCNYSNLKYHNKEHCYKVAYVFNYLYPLPLISETFYKAKLSEIAALCHDANHLGHKDDSLNVRSSINNFLKHYYQTFNKEDLKNISWLITATQWPHVPLEQIDKIKAYRFSDVAGYLRDADVLSSFIFYKDTENLFIEFSARDGIKYAQSSTLDSYYLKFIYSRCSFLSSYTPYTHSGKLLHKGLLSAWSDLNNLSFEEIGLTPISLTEYHSACEPK